MVPTRVQAWRVHDTGLVTAPPRFRRLAGQVRHLQGHGPTWPDRVTLTLCEDELRVDAASGPVGSWPRGAVRTQRVGAGPPVSFVLEVPGGTHLLAAARGADLEALLAALAS